MNTSDYDRCSPFLRFTNDPVARPAISSVDADTNDVARTYLVRIEASDGFINYHGVADQFGRCRAREHEKPPRGDHAIANGSVCRVYQNNFAHDRSLLRVLSASWYPNSEALYPEVSGSSTNCR